MRLWRYEVIKLLFYSLEFSSSFSKNVEAFALDLVRLIEKRAENYSIFNANDF